MPKKARRASASPQQRATTRHDIWAVDLMSEQCVGRQRFRWLVVIDEHSRELLALRAARAFRSSDVVKVLDEIRREHGRAPNHLRSGNGPEFIAADLGAGPRGSRRSGLEQSAGSAYAPMQRKVLGASTSSMASGH